jgi:hypothetical protein
VKCEDLTPIWLKFSIFFIVAFWAFFGFPFKIQRAEALTCNSTGSGNWKTAGTWSCGQVPGSGDDVTIVAGHTVTMNSNPGACNNLTINGTLNWGQANTLTVSGNLVISGGIVSGSATGTLTVTSGTLTVTSSGGTIGRNAFTVGGATTISGTLTFDANSGTGTKTFTGDVTVNSGGVWNETAASMAVGFGGSLTNNATTWTANTGTHTFSGSSKTISGSTATVIPSVSISGTIANSNTLTVGTLLTIAGTLTNNGTVTATTALSGAGGFTNVATGTLNIGAASAITTLTATAVGNTVNYTGTAQTIHNNAYHHLGLSGSGAKTLGTSTTAIGGNLTLSGTATTITVVGLTISGNLDVGTGTTFTAAGFNLTVTGTTSITGTFAVSSATGTKILNGAVTINSGGTWNNSAGNAGVTFRGGLTNNSAVAHTWGATATYTFDTNDQAIGGTNSITMSTVSVATAPIT